MRAVLVLALGLLAGCNIYFGGDDVGDDTVCAYGDSAAEPYYSPYEIINPDTLACEDWGWSGGGGCDDACGPCPGEADAVPLPSWALCDSQCRILDEGTCLEAPGCRATYDWGCYTGGDAPCTAEVAFTGCFPIDMSGPLPGACAGLDAWACSAHDDCVALHDFSGATDSWSTFVECRDEVPTCAANATEEACLAAGEPCIPAYTGSDCVCDEAGVCDCAVWTYRECVENR